MCRNHFECFKVNIEFFIFQGSTKTWKEEKEAPATGARPTAVPHQIQRGHQEHPTTRPTMSLEGRRATPTARNRKGNVPVVFIFEGSL